MAESFISELKRRNVFKVGVAYLVLAWVVVQVADTAVPALHLPDWIITAVIFFGAIGFPFALFFAWAFEITPEGIKNESDISPEDSVAAHTGLNLNFIIIGLLVVALGYFIYESRFTLEEPSIDNSSQNSSTDTATVADKSLELIVTRENVQNGTSLPIPGFSGRHALAVLPFADLSADGDNEHIADGIAENILTSIQAWGTFPVLSRSSTFVYKGKPVDIPRVAEALGVRYILEGSVQRSGDTIRVTAQLIDAETDSHLWAKKYDRELTDVFAIQDDITEQIVTSIVPEITRSVSKRVASIHPSDLAAWELTMKAQALIVKGQYETTLEAKVMLEDALIREPDYALAHIRLAEVGHDLGEYLWRQQTERQSVQYHAVALQNARRAVELDPTLVEGRIWLGHLLLHHREIERGVAELRKGVLLNPSHGQMRGEYGFGLALAGKSDRALEELALAFELSPNDPRQDRIKIFQALTHLYAGDNENAANSARRWIETRPGSNLMIFAYIVEVSAYVRLGQIEKAHVSANEFKSHFGLINWVAITRGAWTEAELNRVEQNLRLVSLIAE